MTHRLKVSEPTWNRTFPMSRIESIGSGSNYSFTSIANVVAKTIELMKQPKSEKIDEDLAELITRNRIWWTHLKHVV